MLGKNFIEEIEGDLLSNLEKIREDFLQEITKIINDSSSNFKKIIYQEYSQILKKLQLESMKEFQVSLNDRGKKSEHQLLIDLAGIIFRSTNI